MNENVADAFSCSYSAVLEDIRRRLARSGHTTATRRRRQVAAPTATMLSPIFWGSSSSNQHNAPQSPSTVSNRV